MNEQQYNIKQSTQLSMADLFDFSEQSVAPEQKQEAKPTIKPVVATVTPLNKIDDFGEKIGGAKKDLAAEYSKSIASVTGVDIIDSPLSKIFPRPNFKKLVEGGAINQEQAIELNYLYNKIPPKPKHSYRASLWAEKTLQTIGGFGAILSGKADSVADTIFINRTAWQYAEYTVNYPSYLEMMKSLDFPYSEVKLGNYDIRKNFNNYSGGYNLWNGKKFVKNYPTIENAIEELKQRLNTTQSKGKNVALGVYRKRGKDEFFIGKIIQGKEPVQLSEIFATSNEAFAYFKENKDQLEQKWVAMNVKYNERRETNRERIGKDWRNGEVITPEKFSATFGFRGVEFGNWVNQAERQDALNDAYDALMDMSDILGFSPKSVSLNGELAMAFGARGSGNTMAHYETNKVVINLTKTKGAGSLAHEWWHALDNYFSRQDGGKLNFQTERWSSNEGVRKEVADAFSSIMSEIRNSDLVVRATRLDSTRGKDYWSTGRELSARAFENFIIEKLGEKGNSSDYLANYKTTSEWLEQSGLDMNTYPYPLAEESPKINEKFEHLFSTIQQTINIETSNVILNSPQQQEVEYQQINHNTMKTNENLQLKRLGTDDWGRPVYEDQNGKLWKDINLDGFGKNLPIDLYSSQGNTFDGEPLSPIKQEYEILKLETQNLNTAMKNVSKESNEKFKKEFEEWSKGRPIVPRRDDVPFEKGQMVSYTNSYGIKFSNFEVLGICNDNNPNRTLKDSVVYLSMDCYWSPVKVDSLTLAKEQRLETAYLKETWERDFGNIIADIAYENNEAKIGITFTNEHARTSPHIESKIVEALTEQLKSDFDDTAFRVGNQGFQILVEQDTFANTIFPNMDAYLNTWSAEDLGIGNLIEQEKLTQEDKVPPKVTLLKESSYNGTGAGELLSPNNQFKIWMGDFGRANLAIQKAQIGFNLDFAVANLKDMGCETVVRKNRFGNETVYMDTNMFVSKKKVEEFLQSLENAIKVGDKTLNGEQVKDVMSGEKVTVSDVSYNGKNCNAKVFVKDGEIKKQYTPATLKQEQKPTATTKRKQAQKRGGVRM